MVKATTKEDVKTMITVFGKNERMSPMIPGINMIGKNARQVVIVDAIIGHATS